MKFILLLIGMPVLFLACKSPQSTDSGSAGFDPDKTYQLRLSPQTGSVYRYTIENKSNITVETDAKEIENINQADIGVTYTIEADSSGNYRFNAVYDKLRFISESNGEKTEIDAANGSFSINPLEKMLAMLKDSMICAVISPTGEVVSISGYQEIGDRMISKLSENDEVGKKGAKEQWDKYVGEGLIRKNFDQLFRLFPDSSIRLGDKWKLTEREDGELKYNSNGYYTLKAINQELAIIEAESNISASSSNAAFSEMGGSITEMTGTQNSQFEIETKTGMVLSCRVKTTIKGMVKVMNKELPVTATITVKVSGKKIK